MTCPPYLFSGAASFPLYTEPSSMDRSIEPEIKRSVSPAIAPEAWSFNAYLMDRSKIPMFGYSAIENILPGTTTSYPFYRPGSPSYTNSSSTCSSALSPPRETDFGHVGSPMTGVETMTAPQFDPIWQYTGLAEGVSLGEIHMFSGTSIATQDDSIQVLEFPTRTCSMSSDETGIDSQYSAGRQSTPDTPIKEEICIPDTINRYASPESEEEHDSEGESEASFVKCEPEPAESIPDDDDDDDDEYTPQRAKRPSPKSNRMALGHKRRSNASATASDVKRAKLSQGDTLVIRSNTKPSAPNAQGQFICPSCPKVFFKDQSGLDAHTKKQHTRPFICVFEFAGCGSTFASKNEWKRHCASQHLALQYWVCQQGACAKVLNKLHGSKKSSTVAAARSRVLATHETTVECASSLPNGTIFNRKDLYTQHLRRMHVPGHLKKQVKLKKSIDEWEQRQRKHQDEALRTRCHLPTHMMCPARQCSSQFDGQNAWDDRMEHVAKHLEKSAAGTEPPLRFGADTDATLIDWAANPAVGILRRGSNGNWALQNPLKVSSGKVAVAIQAPHEVDEDADAEGEDDIDLC
ncbi:hypothetical protein F5Y16DRAFT_278762 [Xylariaceae sp. FL0255]|nr:hypothetical protein F5Y16DRAFT_278762 [Xylariaceae sp. FL0255]